MNSSHLKTNLSSNKLWTKLLDLHPDKENIQLITQPKTNPTKRAFPQITSITGLKRKREEIEGPNFPQICDEIIEIQKETLNKEFTCDLCKEIVLSFASLSPCSHKLCNECLTDLLKYAAKCPLCFKKTKSSTQSVAPELKISSSTLSCGKVKLWRFFFSF